MTGHPTREPTRRPPEALRFLAVALAGLAIDLAIATALVIGAGLADPPAAAAGLFAGMVFNYFAHLVWTFRDHGRRASIGHFLRFAAGVAVTLILRAAILVAIERAGLQPLVHPAIRLGLAAAASFVLSYLIASRLVFTPAAAGREKG